MLRSLVRSGKSGDQKFLGTAPAVLCRLLPQTNNGRDILERLLMNSSMRRSWQEIRRVIDPNNESPRLGYSDPFRQLWSEILLLRKRSRITPEKQRQKTKHLQDIADSAAKLASQVENSELDLEVTEFYPSRAGYPTASAETFAPTLVEVVREVESRALAAGAKRPLVKNKTAKVEARYFVIGLSDYILRRYRSRIHGSVAHIAAVVFDDDEINRDFVRDARRHKDS